MDDTPLVSVIITTYFRTDELRRAIEYVLDQEYPEIELLVVDDSGEQHAEKIVAEYDAAEYIAHQTNRGQIAGWNTGMERASGKYVQFHDDDDWLFKQKIRRQVQRLEADSTVGCIYCGIVNDEGEKRLPPDGNRGTVVEPVLRHQMYRCQTTTMLTRRQLLEKIFPLVEYPAATDIALQLELCTMTEFDYIDEALVHRSLGGGIASSILNRRTRIQLVHEYDNLYSEYPDIRKETLAKSHEMLGETILEERLWSATAITAFVKSVQYSNVITLDDVLWALASLFGQPGVSAYEASRPHLAKIKNILSPR